MERPGTFTKCPCCNNPWSGIEGSFAIACGPCIDSKQRTEGIDASDFDEFVPPHENFYNFAIGGWRKNNPIPPEVTQEWRRGARKGEEGRFCFGGGRG